MSFVLPIHRRVRARLACLLVWSMPLAVAAQTAQLPPVAVVGTRTPTTLDRVVADVVVIDAQRIRDTSADSIEDLLRREGGIQLSRNGGAGQSASVLLRGHSASNTVVLVDGVRIGSATLGQTDLAAIPLAQVERIEVLRGPGSSLYGADAVGGVVNIVTSRAAGASSAWGRAAVGSLGSSEVAVGAAGRVSAIDLSAALSREASDGISAVVPGDRFGLHNPDRDGFERRALTLRGDVALAKGHRLGAWLTRSRLDSQYDGAQFLAPDFLPDPTPDFRSRLGTDVAAVDYRGELSPGWTTSLLASAQRDDLRSGGSVQSRFETRRRALVWQNEWRVGAFHQILGAMEHLVEEGRSSEFASDVERKTTALVLGYTGRFGTQRLQADLRHDDNSAFGRRTTGKLGWSIDLAPGLVLRAVAGTAFRAPTFNDLYFPGYGIASGPFMPRPERARSLEAGIQWTEGASSVSATVFHNRVRDLINYQSDRSFCPADPSYDFGCAGNVGRARIVGLTLAGSHRIGAFALRATLDLLDATDADSGERLTRRAAHQESVALDWSAGAWSASAEVLGVGARPEGGERMAAYQALGLQARWRFAPGWRLELRVDNALDRRYEPALDYQSTGRVGWIGVRHDVDAF